MDDTVLYIESDNTVIISNKNTTIGYATVDAAAGLLSYISVSYTHLTLPTKA